LIASGCCKYGPNAIIHDGTDPKGTWYLGLNESEAPEVVEHHLKRGESVEHLAARRHPRNAKKPKR